MENTKIYSIKKNKSKFIQQKISNSDDAQKYIRQFFKDDIEVYESVFLLLLSQDNKTVGYAKISQGGITATIIDVKIVLKYVVDSLAQGVILCHNHPSGSTRPSTQDLDITKKISKALEYVDTTLLDHIILTKDSYLSMKDDGFI